MKNTSSSLVLAGYLMALYLCVVPLAETVSGVLPIQLGSANWRFGASGLFSQALMTPMLGLFMAASIAVVFQHRVMGWCLLVLSATTGLIGLIAIPLFVADAHELGSLIARDSQRSFLLLTFGGILKFLLAVIVGFLLAFGLWARLTESPEEVRQAKGKEAGLVFSGS